MEGRKILLSNLIKKLNKDDYKRNHLKKTKSLDKSLRNYILFFGAHARINEKVWQKVVNNVKLYDKKIEKSTNFFQKRVDSGQKCVVQYQCNIDKGGEF